MQTMNADQSAYYSNQTGPHQVPTTYFVAPGMETPYSPLGNPNTYGQPPRMPQQFYNNPLSNAYPQQQVFPHYIQNPAFGQPFVSRNPTNFPIIRQSNETPNGAQSFANPVAFSYSPTPAVFTPQAYHQYTASHNYPSQPTQMLTQSQPQYSGNNSQQPTQSAQTSQQPMLDQQSSQSSQARAEKRARKPLRIVDPVSHKAVEVEIPTPATNTPTSTITENSVTDSTNPDSQIQKRADFRKQFAQLLNPDALPEKNTNQLPPAEDIQPSPASSSRSGSISKQPERDHPDAPGEGIIDDKSDQSEAESTPNEVIEESSPSDFIENVEPTPSNDTESESVTLGKTPSLSKRIGYTIEELRQKQLSLLSQERPSKLIEIPGVTSPAIPKHPPKPKIDGDKQYIRDVTAILNKLTPSTYDKLIKQLEQLELNSAERLEAMISVMFIKAVEAAIFCELYANLCKYFEKKQVTVPDETGQPVTYYFRQILLTRCQKEFENDYRQEIEYEKRQGEVNAIVDEKTRREAQEQLEEDLVKAKRKKLGNIIFIGELFKLHMLTAPIMYDCIEYLLRDKTDEEGLECLCRLLRTIGKELDIKASDKLQNRKNLEKNYADLNGITTQKQTSARIRFMIQDIMEMRKAGWVARRVEAKPTTIDEIHEQERIKREQQDIDRERDRLQRRDQNRMGGGPQQYTGGRGSRGSGMKQQSNRGDDDRNDNRVIVDTLRQYQTSEKRNQGQLPLNLAPQRAWGKGSGVEKKPEEDRSNTNRTGKPPAGLNAPFRPKTGASPGTPGYPVQRQPSRELARENSFRDRENAKDSLRKTTSPSGASNPNNTSITNSREGSRNVSREQSRNVSPDSNLHDRTSVSTKTSTTENTTTTTAATAAFDEEKTQTRVRSLIEEYTGNYSDDNDRPVNEAMEDLSSFCTTDVNQQAVVVRELFTNVLEAKPRARKAIGHLLDTTLHKNIFSTEGFLSGIKLFIEVVPDYAVDIPLIWQYIGEILGAFIGAPSSNMILLKPILQSIPETKRKQLFQDLIRYAAEFSSKTQIQTFWQSAGLSFNDLLEPDSSFLNEYTWLTESEKSTKDIPTPNADPQLVVLFKSINDPETTVTDEQIISYIHENMNSEDKYYIRNIVLSYLEACLINREPQKKIQEDIAKKRMTILNTIIVNRPEDEIQAVYAIQNFVSKLQHPSKMARLLFDMFYDEECVSEEAFFEWLKHPDQSETEGHSVVEISTKDFFLWLEQAEPEAEGEES